MEIPPNGPGVRIAIEPQPPYYATTPLKVALLSLATFGFYSLYWFYKQWKQIQITSRHEIRPVWRSIFSPIFSFSFFSELEDDLERHRLKLPLPSVVLGVVFLVAMILRRFDDIYGWLYFAHIVPLVIGQVYANRLVLIEQPAALIDRKWGFGSGILMTLGALVWGLVILGTFGTATGVMVGSEMKDSQLEYLVSRDYIDADERIVYFYSAGVWSIHQDGNIITDRRIVSYENIGGDTYYEAVDFEDIYNIDVIYSDSWTEDTQIIVTNTYGEEVYLVASIEDGLDEIFVRKIESEWRKRVPEGEEALVNPPLEESDDQEEFKVVL